MRELLKENYGLDLRCIEKSTVGAGSDTYFVTCSDGKYVVKYPASSEINHPEAEPELCDYYGQYYASSADNRHIYLHQAVFSTKLLHWLENHVETLTARLLLGGF